MNAKIKAVLERIVHLEDCILKAQQYLETDGQVNADWYGLRPYFAKKLRNGEELPPHKDWVKNVFIRKAEEAIKKSQKALVRLETTRR